MPETTEKKLKHVPVTDPKPNTIAFKPHPEVAAALKDLRSSLAFDPGPGKIIDQALRAFLRSHGYDIPEKRTSDE